MTKSNAIVMSKKQSLQDMLSQQIAALKAGKATVLADETTGEVNKIARAMNVRTEVLITKLYQAKHLVAIQKDDNFQIVLSLVKPNIFKRITGKVTGKGFIYSKSYLAKFFGSIKWNLQETNLAARAVKSEDSIAAVNKLQAIIRNLDLRLDSVRGPVTIQPIIIRK